jgi:hypothetical protein
MVNPGETTPPNDGTNSEASNPLQQLAESFEVGAAAAK